MPRIIFDALAEAQLLQHLQIEARALLQPLRFHQLVFLVEEIEPLAQFSLDGLDGAQHGLARRHVVARRVHRKARNLLPHTAGQRIEQLQRFDFVVEQLQAHRHFCMLGGEDVDRVAAHAEGAALEIRLVACVLHGDQARDHVALADLVPRAQRQDHLVVFARIADTVDGRDGGHDHHIAALQQALGGGEPHLLDVLVDRRILLDEEVALRHVGLRLVVVVVRDEVFDRIAREELAELRIQLRRQRLVRRKHNRRTPHLRDHIGHGEGLARARHAQQCLVRQAVFDVLDELADRFRLVAGRRIRLVQLERRALESHELRLVVRAGDLAQIGHGGGWDGSAGSRQSDLHALSR